MDVVNDNDILRFNTLPFPKHLHLHYLIGFLNNLPRLDY